MKPQIEALEMEVETPVMTNSIGVVMMKSSPAMEGLEVNGVLFGMMRNNQSIP